MTKIDTITRKIKNLVRYMIFVFGSSAIMVSLLAIVIELWLLFNGTPLSSTYLKTDEVIMYWCIISFSLMVYDGIKETFTK